MRMQPLVIVASLLLMGCENKPLEAVSPYLVKSLVTCMQENTCKKPTIKIPVDGQMVSAIIAEDNHGVMYSYGVIDDRLVIIMAKGKDSILIEDNEESGWIHLVAENDKDPVVYAAHSGPDYEKFQRLYLQAMDMVRGIVPPYIPPSDSARSA